MSNYTPPPDSGLEIIHADEALLVLNKPSGLLSVPGRGPDKQDCLAARVQARFTDALVVHRLDMETSGLMVMARGKEMQRALGMLFERRQVTKHYLAVVDGLVESAQGEITLPMITDWPNRPRQKIDHEHGKAAHTRYRVVERDYAHKTTRVELTPITGRSHQLRLHMRALGHAILGDLLYADEFVQRKSDRLLLHACHISFIHPATRQLVPFSSLPPF
ncbi:MAG: pseudouridine synthase [Pseudomonadota bacterium]